MIEIERKLINPDGKTARFVPKLYQMREAGNFTYKGYVRRINSESRLYSHWNGANVEFNRGGIPFFAKVKINITAISEERILKAIESLNQRLWAIAYRLEYL